MSPRRPFAEPSPRYCPLCDAALVQGLCVTNGCHDPRAWTPATRARYDALLSSRNRDATLRRMAGRCDAYVDRALTVKEEN